MSKMKPNRNPPLAKSPIRLRPRRVLGSNSSSLQTPSAGGSNLRSERTSYQNQSLIGSIRKSETARFTGTWEMEDAKELELRPEYRSISWELRDLAKMVGDELSKDDCGADTQNSSHGLNTGGFGGNSFNLMSANSNSSPLFFERGRLYEEYSAKRNERLNRKKKIKGVGGGGGETNYSTTESASTSKSKYNNKLGVTVESAKRNSFTYSANSTTSSTRKLQSLRKSISAGYSVETQRTTTTIECETPTPAPAPAPTPRYMLRSLMNKQNKKPPLPQPTLYSHNHKSAIRGGRKIGAPAPTPTPSPRVGY